MRKMPTFRRDRIRKFWHDVASQKKLAAWDYEAFLCYDWLSSKIREAYEDEQGH